MSASNCANSSSRHLAQLDPHLRREQLLAKGGVVIQFGFDRRRDLVEDEPDAADQQAVDDEHERFSARAPASAGC